MATLLQTFTLFSSITYILAEQCVIDTDCDYPAEICSNYDLTCYRVFNMSHYYGIKIDGTTQMSLADMENILDHNTSTFMTLPVKPDGSDSANYKLSLLFRAKYWIHHIEIKGKSEFDYQAMDRCWLLNSGLDFMFDSQLTEYGRSYTLRNASYPFMESYLYIDPIVMLGYNYTLIDLIIAGATNSPEPTRSPSKSPTASPSVAPSIAPTYSPSTAPTYSPSAAPTYSPSEAPTYSPSADPTGDPSNTPTNSPSVAPTKPPTDDTYSPSTYSPSAAPNYSPSNAPTYSPSAAPTSYPTPDVCEEYLVTQPCCGHFGYEIEDDKVNIRDATLLTCERKVTTECCATTQPFHVYSTAYGCGADFYPISDDSAERSATLCNPSYFNLSLNTTDDIVGEILSGNNTVYNIPKQCDCEWTLDECEGNDIATCGTNATWNDLRDSCNTQWSFADDFLNEACWKNIIEETPSITHVLWEPCSVEAFIGSVTEIQAIPSELVYNKTCICSYAIRNCFVLEDRPMRAQCDFDTDCASDGDCTQELAAPCCGYNSYEDGVYLGVTAALDTNGYPDGSWSCNNNAELCPDIFDGTRKFAAESEVNWWYDLDTDTIEATCGCLYVTEECDLPTVSPTADPIQTTKAADRARFVMISYITYCIVLFIAPLLL